LKFAQSAVGLWAEDPVDAIEVESQAGKSLLQGANVIAGDQPTSPKRENTITKLPASLFKVPESLHANDAVDGKPAPLLKGANGLVNSIIECCWRRTCWSTRFWKES
jgi:hypothetical protein